MMADLEQIADQLGNLTVLEAAELTRILERKWGVSARLPAIIPTVIPATVPVEDEKTEWAVILKDIGPKKIEVIKAIRQMTNLGLKDAKDLAEGPAPRILDHVSRQAAADAKARLEAAGATIEVV